MQDLLLNSAEAIQQTQESVGASAVQFVISVIMIVALWRLFVKAGEPGWKSLIPLYNLYTLFMLSTGGGCLLLILMCIPGINLIAWAIVGWNLAKSYGRSEAFGVGIILIPVIFIPILAFSDSGYIGPRGFSMFNGFGGYSQYQGSGGFNNSQSNGTYQGCGSSNVNRNSDFDVDVDDFDEKDAKTVDFEVESDK